MAPQAWHALTQVQVAKTLFAVHAPVSLFLIFVGSACDVFGVDSALSWDPSWLGLVSI